MSQLKRRKRGSALILVIGVLVLLSIIGTAFVTLMRIESAAARNYNDDIAVRFLAQEALAYCAQHPTWDPPRDASIIPVNDNHVDSDGDGENDCQFFTAPLNDRTRDISARYAILKKPFAGRLNVNRNSGWDGAASDNHVLNAGVSTNEISLVEPVAAYLNYMGTPAPAGLGLATGTSVENYHVAEEISRRICNMRFGAWGKPLGLPPYPAGTSTNARPGEDTVDGDIWLDDRVTLPPPGLPPLSPPNTNDLSDIAAWIGLNGLNWRPNPAANGVDDDGDGRIDELGEEINEPDEFTEHLPSPPLTGSWWQNDDEPFDTSDLLSIVNNSASDLKALINDATQTWAVAQGYAFDGTGATDYFDHLRVLFTTESRDYIGSMTSLNHLNILPPSPWTAAERQIVEADRALFLATMKSVFESGVDDDDEMDSEAASLAAWQVLANYIDFIDEDPDPYAPLPPPDPDDWGLLSVIVKPNGWDVDIDDADGDGYPSAYTNAGGFWRVEDNCRLFFGTERQPYINEIYVYNRGNDRFDNDGDGVIDNDPLAIPVEPPPYEVKTDAYFVELHNHYATDIVLFNNPALATDETLDWAIRVTDSAGTVKGTYSMAAAYKWDGGTSTWITGLPVRVPAGGYLIIASADYSGNDNLNAVPLNNDNTTLAAAGLRLLPDPTALPAGTEMVNFNLPMGGAVVKMFEYDDMIELVYGYDPDGTTVTDGIVQAVVDRQEVPDDAHLNAETTAPLTGTRDFIPSFERHDPRVARIIRGAVDIGQPLTPTWDYTNAETAVPTSGGDQTRHTLGAVNDNGIVDASVFDGNYDLGAVATTRYDDLVDIPNNQAWKFANVGAMGSLLVSGPLPIDPTAFGWSDPATVAVADEDYWLIKCSPYTAVPGDSAAIDYFSKSYPLDAKKIDFTSLAIVAWDTLTYDVDAAPDNFPTGRAVSLFDRFTTFCPRKDGKDNDGDWNASTDESDAADNTMPPNGIDDPGPTPGDGHVDESDEVYVYGRIDINMPINITNPIDYICIVAGLPYVMFDDSTFYRPVGPSDIQRVYLTATTDVITGADGILQERLTNGLFPDRAAFLTRMVQPAVNDPAYNPPASVGAFGRDIEDNHLYEDGAGIIRRTAWPYEWKTSQGIPRTFTNTAAEPYDFILPGEAGDGGDLLRDDKSEIDYTVGALMNMIALETDLPAAVGADLGIATYYITVQVTDGRDVDGIPNNGPPASPGGDHGNDATEPDWAEGTVLSEKRIVVLVNINLPLDDPGRITVFNWEFEGRAPAR